MLSPGQIANGFTLAKQLLDELAALRKELAENTAALTANTEATTEFHRELMTLEVSTDKG
jgi:hypothetical protein